MAHRAYHAFHLHNSLFLSEGTNKLKLSATLSLTAACLSDILLPGDLKVHLKRKQRGDTSNLRILLSLRENIKAKHKCATAAVVKSRAAMM